MRCDRIWHNARLATMASDPFGEILDGVIASRNGLLAFVGSAIDAPELIGQRIDCEGRWITPGLIDCHTHLIHAGNRAQEFELRLNGATYEEIARAGGGIVSTMAATRAASEAELVAMALPRLDALLGEGVTTIEIKSGYGLDGPHEIKQLCAARTLPTKRAVRVATTFLAAHAVPSGRDADAYIEDVVTQMLPQVAAARLADAVDAFCEGIGFSPDQVARVFQAAKTFGLPVKLHADQLSDLGGGALAASFHALSADHIEYANAASLDAMAAAGTVATLLPGAFYFVRETRLPPIAGLRARGIPIALATDCNPGTAPLTSLLLVMNMAATLFHMTVTECLAGVTRNAARALGLFDTIGTLETGKVCDLAIWDVECPAELVYRIGFNPLHQRIFNGVPA